MESELIFGKPHYTSEDGKYAIWNSPNGNWMVGRTGVRGEGKGWFQETGSSSCPHYPAWTWDFSNFAGDWQDANQGMSIYCRS